MDFQYSSILVSFILNSQCIFIPVYADSVIKKNRTVMCVTDTGCDDPDASIGISNSHTVINVDDVWYPICDGEFIVYPCDAGYCGQFRNTCNVESVELHIWKWILTGSCVEKTCQAPVAAANQVIEAV